MQHLEVRFDYAGATTDKRAHHHPRENARPSYLIIGKKTKRSRKTVVQHWRDRIVGEI